MKNNSLKIDMDKYDPNKTIKIPRASAAFSKNFVSESLSKLKKPKTANETSWASTSKKLIK